MKKVSNFLRGSELSYSVSLDLLMVPLSFALAIYFTVKYNTYQFYGLLCLVYLPRLLTACNMMSWFAFLAKNYDDEISDAERAEPDFNAVKLTLAKAGEDDAVHDCIGFRKSVKRYRTVRLFTLVGYIIVMTCTIWWVGQIGRASCRERV